MQERAQLSPSPGGFRNSLGNEGGADRTLGFAGSPLFRRRRAVAEGIWRKKGRGAGGAWQGF